MITNELQNEPIETKPLRLWRVVFYPHQEVLVFETTLDKAKEAARKQSFDLRYRTINLVHLVSNVKGR